MYVLNQSQNTLMSSSQLLKKRNSGDSAMTEFKLMKTATEVVVIGVRDPSVFDESVRSGVEWLDQHRSMIQLTATRSL